MTTTRDHESGQLTPMVIGFVAIALLAVVVVASASKAFLHRRSLAAWADGAAIVAAQSVAEQAIYSGEISDTLPVAAGAARESVGDYVARHRLGERFDEFRVVRVDVDPANDAVTVELSAHVSLVWGGDAADSFDGEIPITAAASAVVSLR